mgnify:CR=1 FL=1
MQCTGRIWPNSTIASMWQQMGRAGREGQPSLAVPSMHAKIRAQCEGLGVGWRSTWEIQAELKRGELVTVLDEFAVPSYDIQAVYPQQRYLPAKVRHFIDYLKAIYNREAYWER